MVPRFRRGRACRNFLNEPFRTPGDSHLAFRGVDSDAPMRRLFAFGNATGVPSRHRPARRPRRWPGAKAGHADRARDETRRSSGRNHETIAAIDHGPGKVRWHLPRRCHAGGARSPQGTRAAKADIPRFANNLFFFTKTCDNIRSRPAGHGGGRIAEIASCVMCRTPLGRTAPVRCLPCGAATKTGAFRHTTNRNSCAEAGPPPWTSVTIDRV